MASPICLRHRSDPVVAICRRCGDGLCDACWAFRVGDAPLCARCTHDLEWRAEIGWSRWATFALIAGALWFWLSRHVSTDLSLGALLAVFVAIVAGVFVARSSAARAREEVARITRREPSFAAPAGAMDAPVHPYRGGWGRVVPAPVALSGRTMALVAGALLLVSGVLLPAALKLPRWMELELVLLSWWAMLAAFLATLLHRGTRVREDHAFRVRWELPDLRGGRETAASSTKVGNTSKDWSWLDVPDAGCADVEGCAGVLVGVALAAAAFAAAWLLMELAFPAVFFLLYWLVVKAIARVANDSHACEGRLLPSIAWGAFWATIYTLPVTLVVWGAHLLAVRPPG